MKDLSNLKLDIKNKCLQFGDGNCSEVRDLCEAICCKMYDVWINEKEYSSGNFQTRETCVVTNNNCDNKDVSCPNRRYHLKRKEDGSCVYLSDDNKCSIHERRPEACRDFTCKDGWKISFAYVKDTKRLEGAFNWQLMQIYNDDMKFVLNPLIKLKTVFYSKEKKRVFFVKNIINKCGLASFDCNLDITDIDDGKLMFILELFNGENDLKTINGKVNEKYGMDLVKLNFYKIVNLFVLEGLIVFKHNMEGLTLKTK